MGQKAHPEGRKRAAIPPAEYVAPGSKYSKTSRFDGHFHQHRATLL
jgi:hypothetical protein